MAVTTIDTLKINVETDANDAIASIDKLTTSLRNLGKSGSSTTTGYKAVASGISNIGRTAKSNLANVNGFTSAIKRLAFQYLSFTALTRGAKASIDLSSGLTEQENVVYTVFGNYTDKLNELLDDCNNALGLSRLTVMQVASNFQQLGVSLGYAQDKATGMSTDLTKLAANMTSMFNLRSVEDAMTALRSVYTGMTRPMMRFGVDLREANIQQWALAKGMEVNMSAMTQAEKVALRYRYTLETLGYTEDDFLHTANTWANSVRTVKEMFKELGTTVGSVIIGFLKPFVIALRNVMTSVINFAQTVANALGAIFGWTVEISKAATMDDAIGSIEDGMSGVADSAGKTASGLGDANTKAKELKRTLLGFDEANILNDPDTGSGGSGGSGGGAGGIDAIGADNFNYAIKHADNLTEHFKSSIKNLEELGSYISTSLIKAMDSINWSRVYERARNFGKGLASFLNGLITPELFSGIGRTIANVINAKIESEFSFSQKFDFYNLGESITTGIVSFVDSIQWDGALANAKSWGRGIADALNGFIEADDPFASVAEYVGQKLTISLEGIHQFVTRVDWYEVGYEIRMGLRSFFKNFKIDSVGRFVWDAINAAIKTATGLFEGSEIVESLIAPLENAFRGLKDAIVLFASEADIGDLAKNLESLVSALKPVTKGFGEGLSDFFINIAKVGVSVIKTISDAIGKIATKLNEMDPAQLEAIGKQLVTIAEAIVAMKVAGTVARGLGSFFGAIAGSGIGGGTGGSGLGGAITGFLRNITLIGSAYALLRTESGLLEEDAKHASKTYQEQFANITEYAELTEFNIVNLKKLMSDFSSGNVKIDLGTDRGLEDIGRLAGALKAMGITQSTLLSTLKQYGIELNSETLETAAFVKLWDLLPEEIEKVDDAVKQISPDTLQNLRNAMDSVLYTADDVMGTTHSLGEAFNRALSEKGDAGLAIKSVIESLGLTKYEVDKIATEIDKRLGDGAFDALMKSADSASESVTGVSSAMQSLSWGNFIKNGISNLASKFGLKSLGTDAETTATKVSNLDESAQSVGENVPGYFKNMSERSSEYFSLLLDAVSKTTEKIDSELAESGANAAEGLVDGLSDGVADVESASEALADATYGPYDNKLIIQSPSKLMKEKGRYAVEGLVLGLNEKIRDVSNISIRIADTIINSLGGLRGSMYSIGRDAAISLSNGLNSVYIRTPHIWWQSSAGSDGNSSWWKADSGINWYAKGGLFSGSNVIGVGEAGKEAVLPLENARTMGMLANAITNKMGDSDLQTAVYNGVLMAMAQQKNNTNVSVTLEGDANKLFRVVQDKSKQFKNMNGVSAF